MIDRTAAGALLGPLLGWLGVAAPQGGFDTLQLFWMQVGIVGIFALVATALVKLVAVWRRR